LVIGVSKSGTPVAEVGADDEDVAWIGEIRRQNLANPAFSGSIKIANHDRDQRRVIYAGNVVIRVAIVAFRRFTTGAVPS
jgi:hypothetical protein